MLNTYLVKLSVAAAACLFLLSAGCIDPKTEAKPAPDTARSAAVTASPAPAPTAAEKALKDLATDADPRVQVAVLNAQGLRESEGRFQALYARVKPKLAPARLGKGWESKELSPADFKAACRVLREMAEEIEAAHVEFVLVADRYEEQLARGPQAYRVAAAYFQDRSVKSSERLFRDGYAELAVSSERFAVLIEERTKSFARFRAEVTEVHAYAKKSSRYVRDVEGFAASTPAADGADFRASHRSFLLVYVRAFNEFLDLTAGFTETLNARPLPASRAETPPATFAFSYQNYAGPADVDAAINTAARKGEAYARLVRDALAEFPSLVARLAPHAGKSLPPALQAEAEDYHRRADAANAVLLRTLSGGGPFTANAAPGVSVGDCLPVVRDPLGKEGGPFFVGVVRVEAVSGTRMTVKAARGTPRDYDCAACGAGK